MVLSFLLYGSQHSIVVLGIWFRTVRSRDVTNVLAFASCDTFLLGADLVADPNMFLGKVDIF